MSPRISCSVSTASSRTFFTVPPAKKGRSLKSQIDERNGMKQSKNIAIINSVRTLMIGRFTRVANRCDHFFPCCGKVVVLILHSSERSPAAAGTGSDSNSAQNRPPVPAETTSESRKVASPFASSTNHFFNIAPNCCRDLLLLHSLLNT